MANDYYIVSGDSLRDVADTIRTKGGTSAQLEYPDDWKDAINAISGGGDEPIPEDGKTRIWIHIAEETPDNRLTFYLRFTASTASNTTVDWGDGVSETLGSTKATNYSHKYLSGGDYVITMTVNSGTISFIGNASYAIYGNTDSTNAYNRVRINRIILGDAISGMGDYVFYNCYTLLNIIIPNGITSIGNHAIRNCNGLTSVTISSSVTSIGASAFNNCYGLTSVTIPSNVTNIGVQAFSYCYGVSEYHFKPTTPPTLDSTNAFSGIQPNCKIYVPQGSLDAYKTATNWSTYASKIQEEPT